MIELRYTQWPHNTGPLMTYMTSCGTTPCDQFDPTGAQWFKIDAEGYDAASKQWAAAKLIASKLVTEGPFTLISDSRLDR